MRRLLLGTMGVKSLVQGLNAAPRPDSNRGPFDPKSDAVTELATAPPYTCTSEFSGVAGVTIFHRKDRPNRPSDTAEV